MSPKKRQRRWHSLGPELVFISYSPIDWKYLGMLMPHLRALELHGMIRIALRESLPPGALWQEAERTDISNAAAAILFVTPAYLDSPDLMFDQLPRLLVEAEERGTAILPLLVKPSLFFTFPHLYRFKAFNSYKTLVEMSRPGEKDRFLVSVAEAVVEVVRQRGGAI